MIQQAASVAPLVMQNFLTDQVEVGIVLLPGFPLYDLAALCDTFRAANRRAGRNVFAYYLISLDGMAVTSSLGTQVGVQKAIEAAAFPDNIILLSDGDPPNMSYLKAWLCRAIAHKAYVLASGSAVILMASAGLLTGKTCAVHWSERDIFEERWPDLALSNRLYAVQDRLLTCAGGKVLIDFALACVATTVSASVARQVADVLNHDRIRASTESQRSEAVVFGIWNRNLIGAIQIIDANLADPLSTDELAAAVGIGPRQLQRLFKMQFKLSPCRFTLRRRLLKARRLVHRTDLSITEVGIATGFVSLSHFSRAYAKAFGHNPRRDRMRLVLD
ncbi:GlxA family transcriptional regulator [Dongia deserti]|uniref:GlxA family transcriptional regulator n=1 Tax=Dongia deserti TaxID=2268030 RepID=UPI0013C4AC4E|nr:helix-turn-helix domain-containing protein [Dongia deserti]